ncbi:MAG: PQQ-binding-like beta-propeller repeat protein [Acidobacteria bacterium]|nr:PQQ-binding-like beta-propeller repeat protein [Acidobacteriota bacterium]
MKRALRLHLPMGVGLVVVAAFGLALEQAGRLDAQSLDRYAALNKESRIAVLGARSAPNRYWLTSPGVLPGYQAAAPGLVSPSFTAAQQTAGQAAYKESCASCHGASLDDGEFAPPLRGPEFRSAWFGQPADALFAKIETMPPMAPGSLGTEKHAELLAYIMSQNQLAAGSTPLPSDIEALRTMLLPGFVGGPSGGLAARVPIPPSPPRPNPLDRYTPVTDAMLQNPPADEWLTWRRGYDGLGYSPLRQITRENVGQLRAAWSWSLPAGPNEATPLFHDGVLFVHAFGDKVQALDAATGDLLWHYSRRLPMGVNPSVKRAIALYGDKVYLGTSDTHVVALDARTGRVVWDRQIADQKAGYGLTGGVTVAKGTVIAGTTGRAGGGNFIVALDANTGEEAWRFNTIPKESEPGGNTWNGVPYEKRNGGSVWVPGAYDAAVNLVYIGVAQTYDTGPYRNLVEGQNNDLLYTDATVAINPDTGKLVWHFQHQPNDQWDYDWAFGRLVLKLAPDGKALVGTGGKQAIFDFVEAGTGTYAFSFDLGLQDVVIGIDPVTGAKRINPRLIPGGGEAITTCPHAGGAKSWLPDSYNPDTKMLFVSLVESCMDLVPVAAGGRGSLTTGVRWTLRPRPDSDGKYGRVQAVNVETRQTLWTMRQRAPMSSGVLATAGGLVFAGALDRVFAAYDDATGRELWRTRLNDVPNSAPITYTVGGRQYVALTVGNGGAQAATFPALVPEIRNPPDRAASLWVFELPERAINTNE